MTIGQRINQARKAKHLSMRGLAQQVEVSAMAISKYEREMDVPGSGVLLRLSQALDVPLDFFFRPNTLAVQLQAYRKHAALSIKDHEAIRMRIQDWMERYLEAESFFPGDNQLPHLPAYEVNNLDDVEQAAISLRQHWALGLDPIENLTQLLEDHGVKVGLISGFEHFDSCTFLAGDAPVIVSKANLPGDRQRFNIAHELGHLVLDVQAGLDLERACSRFAGAFLVPEPAAKFELGNRRTALDLREIYLLKRKYGMSMQAWINRARDLGIISRSSAAELFRHFRAHDMHRQEPGEPLPIEEPLRMERLVYRLIAEDLVSRSRAQELLAAPLPPAWNLERA